MHEVLDHGGIAASTFDLNLRGRMLREKLIPADEILRPRKPENDEQRGSPLWMTSRRCEPLQEQPSTDLLGFHMSQLAAGCEHFRERFLFESNTPALHAVPGTLVNGTLVNGTLVQPNFVAQVVPSGPCHKQMPAPPPTILSAGRTSCSPIGALTKPLHKEEVIASFLPTAM